MAAANVLASHSGRRLYGDLLNAILLSVMLPFVTHKVIETISGGEYGILSSDSSSLIAEKEETAEISHVRVLLQWLSGAVSALFSGVAFYYSWHRLNDASIVHSTEEQKQESFQSSTSSRVVATKSSGLDIGMLAERWSYASFGASTAAMIIGTINNWPHVDEQTLVTHFIWRLVVISANVSYSLKVNLIMAGINLLVALVLVTVCSQLYPLATVGPLLLAITAAFCLAHYWIAMGSRRLGLLRGKTDQSTEEPISNEEATSSGHGEKRASPTIPFSTAPEELKSPPMSKTSFTWEALRDNMAFSAVICFVLYGFLSEVYMFMMQPGYFVTGGFNICQTGMLGAAGFIASGVLSEHGRYRNATTDANGNDKATLFMASVAFQASPTAMAVVDASRRIEQFNQAFEQLLSVTSPNARRQIDQPNALLDTLLGGDSNIETTQRLQSLFSEAESDASSGDTEFDCQLVLEKRILHVQAVPMTLDVDAEAAVGLAPSILFGLRTGRSARSSQRQRFIVVVEDITSNRAAASA